MSSITFNTTPFTIGTRTIIHLPRSASGKLPSRGAVAVEGTVGGVHFTTVLEPDGRGSHWFGSDGIVPAAAGIQTGTPVTLTLTPAGAWPEPEVPTDVKKALSASPEADEQWNDITVAARWDWLRWIRATKNPETRRVRIRKAIEMLAGGKRRPCCFNRNECTETSVAKNGVLQDA